MGDENTDHQWVIDKLVDVMLGAKESILELSKNMHGPVKRCPLRNGTNGHGHRELSKTLVGLEQWKWNCPFCGQEFQD
jgi:hypothetical protein